MSNKRQRAQRYVPVDATDRVRYARACLLALQGSSDGVAFSAALDEYAAAVAASATQGPS